MKITMLGHTDSGKTSFMSAMYGRMQDPVGGFSIRAVTTEDHNSLINQYVKIRAGQWPNATDQRASYDLVLRRGGLNVMPFTWRDYRGGALFERSTEEQGEELIADLQAADGIIAFFPCDVLMKGGAALRPLKRIVSLLGRALRDRRRYVPVALVLSKTDMIKEEPPALEGLLKPLIDQMQASENIVGALFPLTCGPTCTGLDKPALFCLCLGLQSIYSEKVQKIESIMKEYETARRNEGVLDDIDSWLSGTTSEREHAKRLLKTSIAELKEAEAIAHDAKALINYFSDTTIY